jgi:hypothetical protein
MKETYRSWNSTDVAGKITQTATVTFVKDATPVATTITTQPVKTTQPVTTVTISQTPAVTALPTSLPVPKKTTYSPLPAWIALLGIGVAGLFILPRYR